MNNSKLFFALLFFFICSCGESPASEPTPDDNTTEQPEDNNPDETPGENPDETPGENPGEGDNENPDLTDLSALVGFACTSAAPTGGQDGEEVVVETAAQLTSALKRADNVIIYIKGVVEVNNVISVQARNKTLIGLSGSALENNNRTKSGSGILYFKPGSENIILRNLTFSSAGAYDCDGRDNLCIDKTCRIWVDHCDFRDGVDGNFDVKNQSDEITVSWCRFRYLKEPLAGGSGGSDDHRFSCLWGNSDNATADQGKLRTTFLNCWFDEGCRDRMPRVRFGHVHIANCLYSSSVASHCVVAGHEANVYVQNSVFKNMKYDKVTSSKLSDIEGKLMFDGCLFPEKFVMSERSPQNGTLPDSYTLSLVPAEKVEALVTEGAGATLDIKK